MRDPRPRQGEPIEPIRLAARHEAGHIIAAARCGFRVTSSSVTQTADHRGAPYFLGFSHVKYPRLDHPSAPCTESEARASMAVLMAGIASENESDASLLGLPNEWDRDDDPRHRADFKEIRKYLALFPEPEHSRELLAAYRQAVRLLSNSAPVMIALSNGLAFEGQRGHGLFEDTIQALTGALEPLA